LVTTVQDANGYNADFSAALNVPTGVQIGSTLYVSSITTDSPNPEADAGQTIHLTLKMNQAVTVDTSGGSPTLSLSDGAVAAYDSGLSNLTTGILVFDYTVAAADHSPNLTIASVNLNGAAIQDAAGHAADFAGAIDASTSVQIGPSPLTVSSFQASQIVDALNNPAIQVTVQMSEPVVVNQPPTIAVNDGGFIGYSDASQPSSGTLVFLSEIDPGDRASDFRITSITAAPGSIVDTNGYNADFTNRINVPTGIEVGPPVFVTSVTTSAPTDEVLAGQAVELTLNMSSAVVVGTTSGLPSLSLGDGASATYDPAGSNPSGGALAFDYTVGPNDATPALVIEAVKLNGAIVRDSNGDNADFSDAIGSTDLQVGPSSVLAVTSPQIGEVSSGDTVKLILQMSNNVDVDTTGGLPTLSLNDGGVATYDPAISSSFAADSPSSIGALIFDYTPGQTDRTADLEITSFKANGAIIKDVESGANADFSGALNVPTDIQIGSASFGPTLSKITATADLQSAPVNAGHLVTITMELSEPVTVTGTPVLQLNDDNEQAAFTIGSGTNTLTFTYVVQPGDNVADLQATGLNVASGTSIQDAAGNSLSITFPQDLGLQIDTTHIPPTTVQQEVLGLYAALYDRAAEAPGYSFWIGVDAEQADATLVTVANSSTMAVSPSDAAVLGQGFVLTQSTFFNQTYAGLSDNDFIDAMYVNIGGNSGEASGVQYWASLLQQAEASGESVQNARAGLVGQFVHDLSGYNINNRPAGLTDAQWNAAVQRTTTIDNKIAVSIAYYNASQGPGGAILDPHAAGNDPAYQAAIRAIQGVTSDGLTADAAISNIAHAVAAQDLTQIQPVGVLHDALTM
jgi:Domain of unknown function (DUF4214)